MAWLLLYLVLLILEPADMCLFVIPLLYNYYDDQVYLLRGQRTQLNYIDIIGRRVQRSRKFLPIYLTYQDAVFTKLLQQLLIYSIILSQAVNSLRSRTCLLTINVESLFSLTRERTTLRLIRQKQRGRTSRRRNQIPTINKTLREGIEHQRLELLNL